MGTSWTPARHKAFIVSVLRNGTRKYPPKFRTLDKAKTEKKINKATNRLAQHYKCARCKEEFSSSNIEVDHIIPVVDPAKGFTTWDEYIARLYCEEDNLQVLCKPCHKEKTKEEK